MDSTCRESAASGECLMYSVAEAGALLGISRAFAYEAGRSWRASGHSFGRRRLVPKAALSALINFEHTKQLAREGS